MDADESVNACIVAKPSSEASYVTPIHNFVSVLQPIVDNLYVISGDEAATGIDVSEFESINLGTESYTGVSYVDFFVEQFHILIHLLRLRSEVDVVYFHKGAMPLSLPVLGLYPFSVRTCVIKLSDFYTNRGLSNVSRIRIHFVTTLQWLSIRFADSVVVFSSGEVDDVPNDSVYVAFSNYIDFDHFNVDTPIHCRQFDIGFVGRFTEVKGVETFVDAAVDLVDEHPDMEVTMVGDGPLQEKVKSVVADHDRIELPGWIPEGKLPEKYNRIQLLIVPSKSEGLPTVLLEAMGCGSVVVTADVGSVNEVVDHGENGFLLQEVSQEEIVETVEEIRGRDDLNEISRAGREHVIERYSKDAAEEHFQQITDRLAGV